MVQSPDLQSEGPAEAGPRTQQPKLLGGLAPSYSRLLRTMTDEFEFEWFRRRPFPEAVRRALGLPDEADDDRVIAEIALIRLELSVLRRELDRDVG
jgi:hypothetical protein